jgi:hypothetical protein
MAILGCWSGRFHALETLIVGAATGFNPGIMAAAASELLTDLSFWWGGAYIAAGWAFRPVRITVKACRLRDVSNVSGKSRSYRSIPGKSLKKYPLYKTSPYLTLVLPKILVKDLAANPKFFCQLCFVGSRGGVFSQLSEYK